MSQDRTPALPYADFRHWGKNAIGPGLGGKCGGSEVAMASSSASRSGREGKIGKELELEESVAHTERTLRCGVPREQTPVLEVEDSS